MSEQSIVMRLERVIEDRRSRPPEGRKSYVAALMEGGVPAIGAKVTEEAAELVEAAAAGPDDRVHLVREAADLVFHTLVLLGHSGVTWSEVEAELGRRFGIGGFEEKASRPLG